MAERARQYDRIEIELPCRLFIPDDTKKGELKFEAFTTSRNLGLGGVFVTSSFLLKPGVDLWVDIGLPEESLAVRGRVIHSVPLDDLQYPSGMGITFLDVDSHGRETLLRYFTPERYHLYYKAIMDEFPHLKKQFELRDVSLIVNLWEEWKIKQSGGVSATESGAPEPPLRRTTNPRR